MQWVAAILLTSALALAAGAGCSRGAKRALPCADDLDCDLGQRCEPAEGVCRAAPRTNAAWKALPAPPTEEHTRLVTQTSSGPRLLLGAVGVPPTPVASPELVGVVTGLTLAAQVQPTTAEVRWVPYDVARVDVP